MSRLMVILHNKKQTVTAYSIFKELHLQTKLLLLGNVWNVQSANLFEKLGFRAIGTSSAAIAHSLGYEDGQQLSFSELLYMVDRIMKNTNLPLTVDLEHGYGITAAEITANIRQLHNMGIAGINIEDSRFENGKRKLVDSKQFAALLKTISSTLNGSDTYVFINARCDAFLLGLPDAASQAKQRIELYEQNGADGIFLPGICDADDIRSAVAQTSLPINVMCVPSLPDFETLAAIGVKRISMGNFMNENLLRTMEDVVSAIVVQQSFQSLF